MPEKMNKPMQVEAANRLLNRQGVDPSTVDTEALIDSQNHFDENWGELKRKLGIKTHDELMEEIRDYEQIEEERRSEEFRERFEESLEEVKNEAKDVARYYGVMREYVKATVNGGTDSLILFSPPGYGKSYQVLSVLKEEGLERGVDYDLINGYSTPLSLYHDLYENRRKVLVLDDVDGIANDRKALSLLQAVTWSANGPRTVKYRTTSEKLEAPPEFEFEGSVIICLNRKSALPEMGALISRSIFHEIELSYQQLVGGIFPEIAERKMGEDGFKVASYIESNSNPACELEIRDLIKALELYEYAQNNGANWKELVDGLIEADPDLTLVWELMNNGSTTKANVQQFRKETGKSRKTYFNYKAKLESLVGKSDGEKFVDDFNRKVDGMRAEKVA